MSKLKTLVEFTRQVEEAQQAYTSLDSPSIWSDRASMTLEIVVILNFVVFSADKIASLFGVHLNIPADLVTNVAELVTFGGVFVANKLHIASNRHAGK